ncbi:MAG: carbon starvation protein A [Candidatus Eisenbacteria bacterium]|nr:carbon starvation protein A [Candidatus Eisenbacteria bacterium]
MNGLFLAVVVIIWLVIAYRWYGGIIDRRIVRPDDSREPPSCELYDGVDYCPGSRPVLFGHHFSSIAGAGPIIGPVAAVAAFGWGASVLWIALGVVFFGAVHDYVSLMISVRHGGKSLPAIAREVVGPRARLLFMFFVWFALILMIAVFVVVAAQTLMSTPAIVIPTFAIIPIAGLFGWATFRRKLPVALGTIGSLALLGLSIYLGYLYPLSLPFGGDAAFATWMVLLFGYGFIASVLPVWVLLQPRDYISTWVLVIGMVLGFTGLAITRPTLSAPFFTGWSHATQGPLWPMLFILIACGAISGFHSLVAGGTTSKQLKRESDGKPIGFGAMLAEGAVATLAIVCVAAGLKWAAPESSPESFLGVLKEGGPIKAFGAGYGGLTAPILTVAIGTLVGITMLKTFVMTTLDTTVRITRFITSELFAERIPLMANRFVASAVGVVAAFLLAMSGKWSVLWPVFAAANQLVAALTLIVLSAYLVGVRKPAKFTLYPAVFMLATTMGALVWKGYGFLFPPEGQSVNLALGIASAVLLVLGAMVAAEAPRSLRAARVKVGSDG